MSYELQLRHENTIIFILTGEPLSETHFGTKKSSKYDLRFLFNFWFSTDFSLKKTEKTKQNEKLSPAVNELRITATPRKHNHFHFDRGAIIGHSFWYKNIQNMTLVFC